jgi:formate/nitrite transporter FocA (FNT family)
MSDSEEREGIRWGIGLIVVGMGGMVACAWPYIMQGMTISNIVSHRYLPGWPGFVIVGVVGATLACVLWWFAGSRLLSSSPTTTRTETVSQIEAAQLDRGCIQRLCEEFLCDISQGKLTEKLARDYVAKVQMELDRACFPKSTRYQ